MLLVLQNFLFKGSDGAPDLHEQTAGHGTERISQVMQGGGGGKIHDTAQVVIAQVLGCVQAAPGQQGVLDAGGQGAAKTHVLIQVVQLFQKTALEIVSQVTEVFPVVFVCSAGGKLHEPLAKILPLGFAVLLFQRRQYRSMVLPPHIPKIGRFRALDRPGVRHVKDVFQARPSARLADQGNPFGTWLYPAAHVLVPQIHAGAGSGVRALCKDEQLVVKWIFVEPGSGVQIAFEAGYTACHLLGCLCGKLGSAL